MDYCIIYKVEFVDGEVAHTPVGYTTNEEDCHTLNSNYDSTLGDWIQSNISDLENGSKTMGDFFQNTPYVHHARAKASTIEGLGLEEITDINTL